MHRRFRRAPWVGFAGLLALGGCTGVIKGDPVPKAGFMPGLSGSIGSDDPGGSNGGPGGAAAQPSTPLAGPPLRSTVARRLSRGEFARSIRRLIGNDAPVDDALLPADTLTPFDNDVGEQSPSLRLVEATETIARDLALWVTESPERLGRLLPCAPSSPTDTACFERFLEGFGRRILRRPLRREDTEPMLGLMHHAAQTGRWEDAVALALRVFFMHPEFIYRVEPGVRTDGTRVTLSPHEVATRLSFLIEGTTPDDELLAAADSGALDSAEGIAAQMRRLLASETGKEQLRRFHAYWLGYAQPGSLPMEAQLIRETNALIDRATAAENRYEYLFLANETFVDRALAEHYNLPTPAGGNGWVNYQDQPRQGIIAHGLFASAGAKFGDTSPTRRGKFIRERLLCQTVPLPTADVDIDVSPQRKNPDACKVDAYAEHRTNPECSGCHGLMDPLGFGLENLDDMGRYRTHELDRPDCLISGDGQLDGNTSFSGPKELATILAARPEVKQCLGQHFMKFATGRSLDGEDKRRALWLGEMLDAKEGHFSDLLMAYVTHDNFRHREETP